MKARYRTIDKVNNVRHPKMCRKIVTSLLPRMQLHQTVQFGNGKRNKSLREMNKILTMNNAQQMYEINTMYGHMKWK